VVRKIERLERQHALEKERARIANEMHDDLGSSLTQIALLGELANRDLERTDRAGEHIRKITGTAREVFRAMDEIVWAVNPKHDTLSSLTGYLSKFAQDFLRPAGIRCRLDLPEQMPASPLAADERHNLFLTVKEALNNIVKHASASEVWLRVAVTESTCLIIIEDNGRGFDIPTARPGGNGLGSMRERLAAIGGELKLESQPNRGTRLSLVVNLKPSRQSQWN
jgi:signal transduction histidine kinase